MRGNIVRGWLLDDRGLLWDELVADEFETRAGVVRCDAPHPSFRGRRRRSHVCRSAWINNNIISALVHIYS